MTVRSVICKKRLWSAIGVAGCLAAAACAEELTVDFRTLVTATEITSTTVALAITNDFHFSSVEIAISAKNGSGAAQSFGDANGYGLRVWNGTDDRWWDAGNGGEQLRFVFTVRDQNNDRVSANVHVHSLFYRRAAGTGSRVVFDGGDGAVDLLIAGGSAQELSEPYVVNTGDSLVLTRSGTDQIFQLAGLVLSFSESSSSSQSVVQLSDPTISTHVFTAGEMRLGITDNGGGFVNHVSVDGGATDLMSPEAAYGRGWQGSVRDTLHGGRYNPTNSDAENLLPTYRIAETAGAAEFEYVYRRRLDAEERGLVYEVTRSTNVVLSGGTGDGIDETTGAIDSEFESVTNRTSMDVEPVQFLKLDVSLDE